PAGTILPPDQRPVLVLSMLRMHLTGSITPHIMALAQITANELKPRTSTDQVKRLTAEAVDRMPISENVALAIKANLPIINAASVQIELLEERLQEIVKTR